MTAKSHFARRQKKNRREKSNSISKLAKAQDMAETDVAARLRSAERGDCQVECATKVATYESARTVVAIVAVVVIAVALQKCENIKRKRILATLRFCCTKSEKFLWVCVCVWQPASQTG